MKKRKRIFAFLLAVVLLLGCITTALAVSVTVRYKYYVYSDQLTFLKYDYSNSTTPSLQYLTILADSSLGSGSALYHIKYVNGSTVAYCIQPGVRADDSSNYVQGSSGSWYNLPAAKQSAVAMAMAMGYPSQEYGKASGDSRTGENLAAEKIAATQAVIWGIICEYISPYTYTAWGTNPFYTCVNTSTYPTFKLWYNSILSAMQDAVTIPSFTESAKAWCDPIELTYNASNNNYTATVPDTNYVLPDYDFTGCSANGVTFTQSGYKLTITATPAAVASINGGTRTYSTTGSAITADPNEAVLCYYDSTGKYQSLARYTYSGLDPMKAYLKITASVAAGSLEISKTDSDTGAAVSGAGYRIYNSSGTQLAEQYTGTDGKVTFTGLAIGSYTYQEFAAPEGYVLDSTSYPVSITTGGQAIKESRTNTPVKGSITVHKVDAGGNSLQGAALLLEKSEDSGTTWTAMESRTTGTDGIAKWTDLAAKASIQYRITERDAASGYSLLAEPVAVGTLPHEGVYDVSFTVCNTQNLQLPFTGGSGFAVTILFAALAMTAGFFCCKKSTHRKAAG